MDIKRLKPQFCIYRFGGFEVHLRYTIADMIGLDDTMETYIGDNITPRQIYDFYAQCVKAVFIDGKETANKVDDKVMKKLVDTDYTGLCSAIRETVRLSLPQPDPLIIPDPKAEKGGEIDWLRLRALFCDVMKKPDELFYSSTLGEILERWQYYAEIKGYAKPQERMELYDTEGM